MNSNNGEEIEQETDMASTAHTIVPAAAEIHSEISHEHTLYAEPIARIGGFPITNSLLNTWLVVVLVVVACFYLKTRIKQIPGKAQNIMEMTVEGFLDIFDSATGSREKSLKFFPFVFTFFLLILLNNWLGLLPGIGSIGQVISEHGERVFIPFFRGGTADLNTTLALAIIGVAASHIFGVMAVGVWRHFNKFINIRTFLDIPKKIRKDPTVLIVNPIKAMVGLIELVGEAAKIASLSFRLFGNIFAGEVLLASMAAIFAFGLPIPFMFLEIIVGLIQALIFAMLILVYLSMHTTVEEH